MNDLITLDWTEQQASVSVEAEQLKARALELSNDVWAVNDATSQEVAVAAQQEINGLLSMVEKARKSAKEPALEFGRRIDDAAKAFVAPLKTEQLRLSKIIGDFQMLEEAKVRAAQQAENERLAQLEREKAAEVAKAKSHKEIETIQELYAQRAAQEAQPVVAVRAEGQVVRKDWNVTVTDIWLLARSHPSCVKLEPLMGEIKCLLKAGAQVKGVTATLVTKSTTTTTTKRLIEI